MENAKEVVQNPEQQQADWNTMGEPTHPVQNEKKGERKYKYTREEVWGIQREFFKLCPEAAKDLDLSTANMKARSEKLAQYLKEHENGRTIYKKAVYKMELSREKEQTMQEERKDRKTLEKYAEKYPEMKGKGIQDVLKDLDKHPERVADWKKAQDFVQQKMKAQEFLKTPEGKEWKKNLEQQKEENKNRSWDDRWKIQGQFIKMARQQNPEAFKDLDLTKANYTERKEAIHQYLNDQPESKELYAKAIGAMEEQKELDEQKTDERIFNRTAKNYVAMHPEIKLEEADRDAIEHPERQEDWGKAEAMAMEQEKKMRFMQSPEGKAWLEKQRTEEAKAKSRAEKEAAKKKIQEKVDRLDKTPKEPVKQPKGNSIAELMDKKIPQEEKKEKPKTVKKTVKKTVVKRRKPKTNSKGMER